MNTITLTLEATPENLDKIKQILGEEAPAPKEEPKKAAKKKEKPKATTPEVTKTDLRNKGLELTKAGKSDEMKAVFEEFGAAKLSEVKEEDYAAVMEKLEALS